jgi:hypothetical protein
VLGEWEPSRLSAVADLPEPTPSEARALILGIGTFWLCWGLSVPFFASNVGISVVPFFLGFAAGAWAHFGGIFPLLARAEGRDVSSLYFTMQVPWSSEARGRQRRMWQVILPSSFRRAAAVLGWNQRGVIVTLGSLLAVDLVAAVWLFVSAPGQ